MGKALFFMLLILFVPVGIFIHRQPISLTLDNGGGPQKLDNVISSKSARKERS
jgi:hypothetical protein